MLSIERIKELLNDPAISDSNAKEIRDGLYMLAEIIFEKWQEDKKARLPKGVQCPETYKGQTH